MCLQLSQGSSSSRKFHVCNLEVGLSLLIRGRQSVGIQGEIPDEICVKYHGKNEHAQL